MHIQWTHRPHQKITRSCGNQIWTCVSQIYHYIASQVILDPYQATQTCQLVWICDCPLFYILIW